MKTMRVLVMVEIRADETDEDQIREAVKDAMAEAMEDDTFEFTIDETEDDDDFI